VLAEELRLRDQYRQQAVAQQALDSHEKLKTQLRAILAQRPLNQREMAIYHESREQCRNALKAANVLAAEPLDTQAAPAQLRQKKASLQQSYLNLKAANADLYTDPSGVADPCMPCLQDRANALAKTAKIKSLKARQEYNNCGVMSSAQLLNLVTCPGDLAGVDEETMLDEAMDAKNARRAAERDPTPKDHPKIAAMSKAARARYESGGTSPDSRKKIIDSKGKDAGVSVEQKEFSEDALGEALKANKPVILSVDAHDLRPGYDDSGVEMETWTGNIHGAHAITAVDARYDASGKITDVLISDTGCGKQYWMKASDVTKAIQNHPGVKQENQDRAMLKPPLPPRTTVMNVSNKPIKTDCKK
jgi:hypothetical protein